MHKGSRTGVRMAECRVNGPMAVISRIKGLKKTRSGWLGLCPAHPDRERSLSLRLAGDGRLLVNCFAGCRTEETVAGLGFELRDLFPEDHVLVICWPATPTRSPVDRALAQILGEGRRQQARLARYRTLYAEADCIRLGLRLVARARAVGTGYGDSGSTWGILDGAAAVEREAFTAEADLDQLLADKRLP